MINKSQVFVSSRPALQDALKEKFSLRLKKKKVDGKLNTHKEIKNTIEITLSQCKSSIFVTPHFSHLN